MLQLRIARCSGKTENEVNHRLAFPTATNAGLNAVKNEVLNLRIRRAKTNSGAWPDSKNAQVSGVQHKHQQTAEAIVGA